MYLLMQNRIMNIIKLVQKSTILYNIIQMNSLEIGDMSKYKSKSYPISRII